MSNEPLKLPCHEIAERYREAMADLPADRRSWVDLVFLYDSIAKDVERKNEQRRKD